MKPQLHIERHNGTAGGPLPGEYIAGSLHRKDTGGKKPLTALWTSTWTPRAEYASAWDDWCASEEAEWRVGPRWAVYPRKDARVYVIDSVEDVLELARRFPGTEEEELTRAMNGHVKRRGQKRWSSWADINWVAVAQEYDGVHLTRRGQQVTRFPGDDAASLYGWDCESTAWFRNVFKKTVQVYPVEPVYCTAGMAKEDEERRAVRLSTL